MTTPHGSAGLGRLYLRGAVGSARHAVRRALDRSPEHAATTVDADALAGLPRLRAHGLVADPDRLTAYQHLVGEPATDALPAGFVHVLTFPTATALLVHPRAPLPLVGLVHLANRVQQRRPVLLGEPLDVVVHAHGLAAHHAGVSLDVVAEVSVGDEPVWTGTSTYLARGLRLAGADRPERPERSVREAGPAGRPTARWRLTPDDARRYAAVSGDRNPIHTSTLGATAFGFARPIAHGMLTAARALADVGPARGPAFTWTVDFAAPVLLPGTVDVRVEPTEHGVHVTGWDPRTGRPNLDVLVAPA